jgi:hypothetical protein
MGGVKRGTDLAGIWRETKTTGGGKHATDLAGIWREKKRRVAGKMSRIWRGKNDAGLCRVFAVYVGPTGRRFFPRRIRATSMAVSGHSVVFVSSHIRDVFAQVFPHSV